MVQITLAVVSFAAGNGGTCRTQKVKKQKQAVRRKTPANKNDAPL
jgi:hypothetical protein